MSAEPPHLNRNSSWSYFGSINCARALSGSVIDVFDGEIRRLLADTPDMKASTILERLRPLVYSSGITILRERVRLLRPRPAPG